MELLWLTSDIYEQYQLFEMDWTGAFADEDPAELLITYEYLGFKWDWILVVDDVARPVAIIAIQLVPGETSIRPVIHFHIAEGFGRVAIRNAHSVVDRVRQYYGVNRLSICRQYRNETALKLIKLLKIDDITIEIDENELTK